MNTQNFVLDEGWNVVWNYSETPQNAPVQAKTATHFFQKMAVKLLNKPSSLRSEKRETELDRELYIAMSEWKDQKRLDMALQALADYLETLLDGGDKAGAEAVIDKFHEAFVD